MGAISFQNGLKFYGYVTVSELLRDTNFKKEDEIADGSECCTFFLQNFSLLGKIADLFIFSLLGKIRCARFCDRNPIA